MIHEVPFILNGRQVTVVASPSDLLLDVLRRPLGMTGVKEGCGQGECGACTVIVDGRPINAGLFPDREARAGDFTAARVVLQVGLGGALRPGVGSRCDQSERGERHAYYRAQAYVRAA